MDEKGGVCIKRGETDLISLKPFLSSSWVVHEKKKGSPNSKPQEEKWRWNFDFIRNPTKKEPF